MTKMEYRQIILLLLLLLCTYNARNRGVKDYRRFICEKRCARGNKIIKHFIITVRYLFTRGVLKIKINIGSNRMLYLHI